MKKVNSITQQELVALAQTKNLTITPNNRTAATLTDRVVSFILDSNNTTACVTPNIVPLSRWIAGVFSELRASNIMPFSNLSIIAETDYISYWIRAMHFDDMNESLVNPSEWISDAISADKSLSRWEVNEYQPDSNLTSSFKRWRKKVHSELQYKGFVTQSKAIELIIDAIKAKKLSLPQNVFLYAFDEMPPLYKTLFNTIKEYAGLDELKPVREKSRWLTVETEDENKQLETVARWASKVIETEPTKTICIVSPDLKQDKKAIIKSLNAVFEPQSMLPDSGSYSAPYDVSLGKSLALIPIYRRALYYLGINDGIVPSEDVLNIVKDPFTTSTHKEKMQRRKFANVMRDNRGIKTSLVQLAMRSSCPSSFATALNGFVRTLTQHPEFLLPSRWAQLFHNALSALGWAKGVRMNEFELAGLDKWKVALDSLSCLDIHTGEVSKSLALKILNQYCNNLLVTPQLKGSPISVMGTLEAAGLDFDYIWVLNCNDNIFPAPASLNSCLPVNLQIEKKMPHSSGEREFDFTEQLFTRYSGSCDELYTSYIKKDKYGAKKAASILEHACGDVEPENITDNDIINYKEIAYKQFSVYEQPDEIGFQKLENNIVPGGVAVLDKVQLCPMQAITNIRLKVNDHTPNYTMGITGAERGEILHNALEFFWDELMGQRQKGQYDSDNLKALDTNSLRELLNASVDSAFFWLDREDIEPALIEKERQMMLSKLNQWIELEKNRDTFNVIALEKTDFVNLGGLKIKIRKDREDEIIDSNNNHKTLALDIKSREESISSAFSSSMPKSQLPLAALSGNIDGIAYLNVIPHSPSISGVINSESSDDMQLLSEHKYKAPKDWDKLKDLWLKLFSKKIGEYVSGVANYTPSVAACMYCAKKSLCRHSIG